MKELQERSARRVELDRVDILRMLLDDREMARDRGQAAASIKATELLGRELCGMFTERRELGTPADYGQLSDAELREEFAQQIESMGEPTYAAKIRRMGQA